MNLTSIAELGGTAALIVALALFIFANIELERDRNRMRREISRFPLFAARDHLVHLVAEGRIKEQDPAFQSLYERVNFFLRMDQSLNLWDLVWRYGRSQIEAEKNPALRDQVQKTLKMEREKATSIPEYARIVEEASDAMMYLVRKRTTRIQRNTVLLLSVVLNVVAAMLSGRVSVAKAVSRSRTVTKPSSENVLTWQTVESSHVVA